MRAKTRAAVVASLSATALLTACGGGGGNNGSGSGSGGDAAQPAGKEGGSITVRGCNPQNPLIGSATNETCGGNILDASVARLVHYNNDTAKPENDIAESIDTKDNQTFTVKLKKGYKFQDGTEVKAKNFVDAWNWGAYSPNAQQSASFFAPIEGYGDVHTEDPDGPDGPQKAPAPKGKTMSGLKVVDDHTFTIKTTEKVSNLPVRLGYSAFAPLPDMFFSDPKAYGKKPISAGPYQVMSWTPNQSIVLKKFDGYSGQFKGHVDQMTWKMYQDTDAAYKDVMANQLDFVDEVPTSALLDEKYKRDLKDRNASRAEGVIHSITFAPTKVDPSLANPKLRQAISMAIDRDTIIKTIFAGSRQPATGWVSPVVDGYKAGACGDFCKYDPAKAKALLAEAGGYNGTLTLSYNANAPHKDWTEATCNSIKNALGVNCVAQPITDFATFRDQITKQQMKGMFRTAWQMDYPSIENFLSPVFKTEASSNDGHYSNPAFDKKLAEAAAATDASQANALYQEAEKMLANDMPSIPTWYGKRTVGWSNKVTNVKISAFGTLDTQSIQVRG